MSWVKYKTKGFKELAKALDNLTEPKFRSQALRKAGKAAMTPTLHALKSAAPVIKNPEKLPKGMKPGELSDGIKMVVSAPVQPKFTKKTGKITKASEHELKVTIYTGKGAESYAIVSEYGREETPIMRYHVFGKPVLGYKSKLPAIEPKPWMRPTFDKEKGDIVDRFAKELTKSIEWKVKQQNKIFMKRAM